ncbi:MAG: peptide chain release factor 2 [Bacilli bacterium]
MENYEIVRYIEDFKTRITELQMVVKLDVLNNEIEELEKLTYNPNFYNDPNKAAKIIKELNSKKNKFNGLTDLISKLEELELYFEMHQEESLLEEITEVIGVLEENLSKFEVEILLSNEYDDADAIIDIHPGAGGTESQDWASMLLRMYKRYAERSNFGIEVIDYQDGDEAGIKSATLLIKGEKAYGYLKSEQGVHRLIRISPFDSNSRRHTSFASITVTPQIDANINIEIKPEDIRVDTYRASGAGGQHVNKTDSAVRITHLKTGIVVTCQNERSQMQNRERAFEILKSKLYQLEQEENDKKIKKLTDSGLLNSFGSQIRTYTFHPYSLVKDSRTGYEVGNVNAVMDGDLDGFVNAYLKSKFNVR